MAALAANRTATVHAFEPTPEIAERLRHTATLNGLSQIHVHELAIFSGDTEVALQRWRGEDGDNEGMNFVSQDTSAPAAEIVRGVSLDRFCADNRVEAIDLMKIDIQGQEAAALRGAAQLLREGRIGAIFLELNWADHPGQASPATEAVELLSTAGYSFAAPCEHPRFRPPGDWLRGLSAFLARPAMKAEQDRG